MIGPLIPEAICRLHQPRLSAWQKNERKACAAVLTDLLFQPAAPFKVRNSSTSSSLAADNNRCRVANHLRKVEVFHRWDFTEAGERPFSSVMYRMKSSSCSENG